MGEVYRARDARLRREVALKVIAGSRELGSDRLRRFADEARAAGALNHPNVLAVYDVGLEDDPAYVVFELLDGETVRQRLQRGALPSRKAVELAAEVCEGLAAAHDKGIVHRDIKPDNLFLTRDGRVKILDFGLAKLSETATPAADVDWSARTATAPGVLLGTVPYMSPEQARGETADARSDIFALGATLHEMLTGRPAFQRATAAETLHAIQKDDPPEIDGATARRMPPLAPILRRCLEKDRERRFQSARDLGFALGVLASSNTPAPGPSPTRRRWVLPALGAALVLAAAALSLRRPPRVQPTVLSPRPFTAFSGRETAASFSPDGSHIAFAWAGPEERVEEEGFHLYVKGVDGETPLRLTTRPGKWIAPASTWFPWTAGRHERSRSRTESCPG